jgi:hypothetical protein
MAQLPGTAEWEAIATPSSNSDADFVSVFHKTGTKRLWLINEDGDTFDLTGGGGGGLLLAITEIDDTDSPYTAGITEDVILADTTSGDITINLPALSVAARKPVTIKNIGTGVVTLDGNASETIDGETTQGIVFQYDAVTVYAGTSEWSII